jgi:hypothetical protein
MLLGTEAAGCSAAADAALLASARYGAWPRHAQGPVGVIQTTHAAQAPNNSILKKILKATSVIPAACSPQLPLAADAKNLPSCCALLPADMVAFDGHASTAYTAEAPAFKGTRGSKSPYHP